MLHLSRGVFGADFGSVSTVIQNIQNNNAHGIYFRLIERTFQEFDQNHLKNCLKELLKIMILGIILQLLYKGYEDIVFREEGARIYYPDVKQK